MCIHTFRLCLITFFVLSFTKLSSQLQPVTLPLHEDFENATGVYNTTTSCVYCNSKISFDYAITWGSQPSLDFTTGYSSIFSNAQGNVGATLKGGLSIGNFHMIIATIDMSNYDTSDAGSVLFRFDTYNHYDEHDTVDVVEIRGSSSDSWIELYDLSNPHERGTWVRVENLNVTTALESSNQNFSASFQLRINHRDNSINLLDDGRTFDEFLLEYDSCSPPQNPVARTNLNGLTLKWHKANSADSTEILFGPSGFFSGGGNTGHSVTTSADSLFIDTLSPGKRLDFWIRNRCGSTSRWIGPIKGHSQIKAPFFETFARAQATPISIKDTAIRFGGKWLIENFFNFPLTSTSNINQWRWRHEPPNHSGPYAAAGNGNGGYIINSIANGGSSILSLIPPVSTVGLINPELRFSYHIGGTATSQLTFMVEIDTGNGWQQVYDAFGPGQPSRASAWTNRVISLGNYAGLVQVRFISQPGSASYIALDEVAIDKPMTCPRPYNLNQIGGSSQSVRILFTSSNPNNNYELSYGVSLQNANAGTKATFSGNAAFINNLLPNTEYCVYLRAICGQGDTSYWSEPLCVLTQCLPGTVPYQNNFDSVAGPELPPCWTSNKAGSTVAMIVNTTDPGKLPPSPPNMLELNDADLPNIVASPPFSDLKSGLNRVRFKLARETNSAPTNDSLFIGVMSNPYVTSSFKKLKYLETQAPHDSFQEFIIPLEDTALIGNSRNIAFRYGQSVRGSFEFYIDDFFYEPNPCLQPTGITIQEANCEEVILGWNSQSNNVVIEYGPTGFLPGTGVKIGLESNPDTIFGLGNQLYDFYVATLCSPDTGIFSGPITGRMDNNALPTGKIKVLRDSFVTATNEWFIEVDGRASIDTDVHQWFFNKSVVGVAPVLGHNFNANNLPLTIRLVAMTNCGKTDTAWLSYVPLSNSNWADENVKFSIYPNPNTGKFKIEWEGEDELASVTVFNSDGQKTYFQKLTTRRNNLEIALDGAKGLYILRLSNKQNKSRHFRIIKQ